MDLVRRVSFTSFKTIHRPDDRNYQKVIDMKSNKVTLVRINHGTQ